MHQKSVLITGCSSGIGHHAAHALKDRGYRVFATARKTEDVERLKREGLERLQLDLDDPASIQKAVADILAATGGTLDALSTTAATASPARWRICRAICCARSSRPTCSAACSRDSVSPDLKLGMALTGNFGMPLNYDEGWVGRYYVQEATMLGLSVMPTVAYRVSDKVSVGAGLNAMYGIYKNQVAINNVNPLYGDGQLKMQDETWGWGANVGVLFEPDARTRFGLVWNSQINLDFSSPLDFSNLAPVLQKVLNDRGLLNASLNVGIKVPQDVMLSAYTQTSDRWALLGSVGWQQWSKFGQVQLGIDDATNPASVTQNLELKDTWHVAVGAQYRPNDQWKASLGLACDSGFRDGNDASPLPPVLGGRGNLVGGLDQTLSGVLTVYGNWAM